MCKYLLLKNVSSDLFSRFIFLMVHTIYWCKYKLQKIQYMVKPYSEHICMQINKNADVLYNYACHKGSYILLLYNLSCLYIHITSVVLSGLRRSSHPSLLPQRPVVTRRAPQWHGQPVQCLRELSFGIQSL